MTAQLVDEGSAIVLKLLTGFERALPAFVFLSMLSTGLTADVDTLLSYGRMIMLFASFLHRGDGGAICVCRPQDGVFGQENVGDPAANLYGAVGLGLLLLRLFRRL